MLFELSTVSRGGAALLDAAVDGDCDHVFGVCVEVVAVLVGAHFGKRKSEGEDEFNLLSTIESHFRQSDHVEITLGRI